MLWIVWKGMRYMRKEKKNAIVARAVDLWIGSSDSCQDLIRSRYGRALQKQGALGIASVSNSAFCYFDLRLRMTAILMAAIPRITIADPMYP